MDARRIVELIEARGRANDKLGAKILEMMDEAQDNPERCGLEVFSALGEVFIGHLASERQFCQSMRKLLQTTFPPSG